MVLMSLALISGLLFVSYGLQTLFGDRPKAEFERYGMPGLRTFVGVMQLLGAGGLLVGLGYHALGALAAGGLATMMALGLIVRVRIHDAPKLMIPAASLAALNILLVVLFLVR